MVETLWDAITRRATDFIEGGQDRRQWLDDLGRKAEYYVPPELRNILGFVAEATPTAAIDRAAQAGGEMLAPGRTPMQRLGSAGEMLSETAGVVAPAMVANRAALPAAQAIQESLLGASMAADDVGRRFVERLNQPGPVPTMNAIFPSGSSLDEVFGFLDKNKPIYHSGPADMAEEMQKWGVEPSYGPWVREIAAGAVDDVDEFLDQTPPAAWWSDQPDWIKMKVARAAKKPVSDVTVDDIRKHGHLAIASADDYSDVAFRIGDEGLDSGEYSFVEDLAGNRMRFYETPLYSEGNYPFGIERNEIVTGEAIEPAYSLTGDDLVNFMQRQGLLDNPVGRAAGDDIEATLRAKYPDAKIYISGDANRGYTLSQIELPKNMRNSGVGSNIMQDFVSMADAQGAKINLTPSKAFGGSVARLKDFYKRFGFVENKGKNKDFSTRETMYREPSATTLPAPRNEAEAMAKQVLEMRAAGRAGDVTEEMMAATDPQYMFANTPLPMDEASRMARARELGLLDDQYHATTADFQAFMPSETGLSGRGIYTGDYPTDIADYATKGGSNQGLNVIPLLAPAGSRYARNIDWQRTLDADTEFPYNATAEETIAGFKRAADTMSQQGYAGVHNQAGERVTFNPSDLRSRFARFDPAFSHLRNLSAGIGGLGILSLLAQQEQEVQ